MKDQSRFRFVSFFILASSFLISSAQVPPTRFDPRFENQFVSVFSLDLLPGRRAAVFQNTHDIVWIALSPARVIISGRDGAATPIAFRSGDARFFPSFRTASITNDGAETFRGVLIQIKPRGLASSCDCDSQAERAVCGCARSARLPEMWAVGIGSLVLGGTTLAPGQSFQRAGNRADTLLVALSTLALADDASSGAAIHLRSGEVRWLDRGVHKFRNTASTPARYITLEF
jgi:hypothetical protein